MFLFWRKKIKLRYYLDMKKKSPWRTCGVHDDNRAKQNKRFPDDFGLRSPVVQKKKSSEKVQHLS